MSASAKPSKAARTATAEKPLKITKTGLPLVDALSINAQPSIQDYIGAVSEYVLRASTLPKGAPKQAQIALGAALGRVLSAELTTKVPRIRPHSGERTVAGALRDARADVSEAHHLDGLRLAVEIKPVNLAVGRAMWNRFGDIRAFAVNIHLKFPFAVVGGVLAIPSWEWKEVTKTMQAEHAKSKVTSDEQLESDELDSEGSLLAHEESEADEGIHEEAEAEELGQAAGNVYKKSTVDLITRLIRRLMRTRLRDTEADPPHLLEGVAVIVYDPDTASIHKDLPPPGSKLRWEEFVSTLAETYDVRFD